MKLPNVHRAQIERGKITDYLLSLVNPRSRAKADFFLSFGFSRDRLPSVGLAAGVTCGSFMCPTPTRAKSSSSQHTS